MSKTINLSLDTSKSDIQNPKILLRQGDGNYQTLRVTITSNGEPTDLTNADVVYLGTTSADHKIIDSNITKVDALNGVIDYRPPKQWGQDMGNFKNSYFEITTGDSTGSTASFKVSVLESVDLNAEQAGDYITVVDGIVAVVRKELSDQLADVTTKTDNATGLVKQASDNLVAMAQKYNTDITNKYNDANAKAGNINQLLNAGAFAKVGASNTFNENQTISKDLTVGGALHANADNAVHSDKSSYADKAGLSGWANGAGQADYLNSKNDQTVNNLTVNGYHHVNGDSITQKLDVNGSLFAHQDIVIFGNLKTSPGQKIYHSKVTLQPNLDIDLFRIGNIILARFGGRGVTISSWTQFDGKIPLGYRPAFFTSASFSVDANIHTVNIWEDGGVYNRYRDGNDSGGAYHDADGSSIWFTKDDYPD